MSTFSNPFRLSEHVKPPFRIEFGDNCMRDEVATVEEAMEIADNRPLFLAITGDMCIKDSGGHCVAFRKWSPVGFSAEYAEEIAESKILDFGGMGFFFPWCTCDSEQFYGYDELHLPDEWD